MPGALELLDDLRLVIRADLRAHVLDAKLARDRLGRPARITRHEHRAKAHAPELRDRVRGRDLRDVGDRDDRPGFAIDRRDKHGAPQLLMARE